MISYTLSIVQDNVNNNTQVYKCNTNKITWLEMLT